MYLREFTGDVTCSRRCKSISSDRFFFSSAFNLYVARRALTYTIVFTPREYETFHRAHFFVRSLLRRLSHSYRQTSTRFRLPPEVDMTIIRKARNEGNEAGKRGPRRSLEGRKEKTYNVYSSPIEDERSFQGSASVARIWIWKYATN